MADLLTTDQKTKQRSDGHKSKFFLSIVRPATLLSCQVNGSPARGAISISIDNGTGTASLLRTGMTVKVVNSYGEFETRLVAASLSGSSPTITGTLTLDPNHILWENNDPLVIEDMFDPRVIQPEFDASTGISKKRSQTFSGQTAQPGPLLRMEGHKAAFIDPQQVVSLRVSAGPDDGHVTTTPDTFAPAGLNVTFGSTGIIFDAWFRRPSITIPPGAIILAATVTFVAASNQSGDIVVSIAGELAANPAAPTDRGDYFARTRTTAVVNWSFSTAWVTGQTYTTPDLSAIFQEIIDQGGWASGNAVQLFVEDNGSAGIRQAVSFNDDPDQAALLEITYVVPVSFDLDATGVPVAPGSSISSYLWQCPAGGTIASPNAQNTTIEFDTPGGYWVYCTVTDSNGKTLTGVRHYWVFDPDPESADYPYVDFENSGITVTVDGGGQFSVTVSGVADFTAFRDGALVALWRRAWFGSEEGPISLIPGSENFVAMGYIAKDSISVDSEHGTVAFEVQLPANVLKNLPLQALSIHAEQTITYWFQTERRMTLLVALFWLLYWHSNALEVMEWFIPTGGLYKKLFKFNEGSLYSQVADLASKFRCQVGCDKAGRMFVEAIPNLLTTANRNGLDTLTDLTDADWREKLVITRRHKQQTAAVSGKGFFYDGANVLTPFCSVAPTKIRESVGGGPKSLDGLVVADQAGLNYLTGQYLAIDNSEIDEIRLSMAGDYSVIDVYPQRWHRMTLAAGDTPRGISVADMRLLPISLTLVPDAKNGYLGVDVVFKPEVFGPDGINDPCPTEGEVASSPLADAPRPDTPSLAISGLAAASSLRYLAGSATAWTAYDEDFVANDSSLDPFWKLKQKSTALGRAIFWLVGNGGAVRQVVGSSEKTDRNVSTDPPNSWSDGSPPTAATINLARIASSIFTRSRHYVAATWQNGSSAWRSWVGLTNDDFVSVAWSTLFEGGDVQTKILSIAEDIQDGSRLWLTCWRNGELWLERWETSGMTRELEVDLGAATEAQLDARTYYAEVAAGPGDKNDVWVFGRMVNPAGLTGTYHIIQSTDAENFSSFLNSWGADHCAAFIASLENDAAQRTFYAVRAPEL